MSPRVFDGWVPLEVHEHFDAADVFTGTTVVHRESEWDDTTRQRVEDLAEHERTKCPCGCGQQSDVAWNAEQTFSVDHYTCYAARARTQVERKASKDHENAPEGWDDGRHYYVVPVEDDRPVKKRRRRGDRE